MEVPFEITAESLEYAPKHYGRQRRLRPFRVTGRLHDAAISTSRPLTGEVVVEESECPIKVQTVGAGFRFIGQKSECGSEGTSRRGSVGQEPEYPNKGTSRRGYVGQESECPGKGTNGRGYVGQGSECRSQGTNRRVYIRQESEGPSKGTNKRGYVGEIRGPW